MKPSEMTNEELANRIENPLTLTAKDYGDCCREAAARLRTFTLLSKAHQRLANDSVDYSSNLLRKLKVAEDALQKIFNKVFVDCEVAEIANDALAAIREEGDNNENK